MGGEEGRPASPPTPTQPLSPSHLPVLVLDHLREGFDEEGGFGNVEREGGEGGGVVVSVATPPPIIEHLTRRTYHVAGGVVDGVGELGHRP